MNGHISTTNGSVSGKVVLSSTTYTANCNITEGTGSCTGTAKPTAPSVAGVYIGMDTTAAGGIETCSGSVHYIDFKNTFKIKLRFS